MPNYSLESEGHYNPYAYTGFQDAIDAVLKQQDEIDDAYAELKDKAFAIGSLIDPNDKDAYNMYQTYMNMLDSGVNDLMSNGLNYNSRRHMQDIKSLYNRYMVPLSNAYAARAAEIKSQQDAYDKDNSIRYEREAAATNLSNYLRNPNLHARSASGRNIMANVSTMLQNVALGAARGDENSRGILRRMFGNNIDYEYVYQHGFDLNTIADAIANIDDPKYAALKQMVVQAEKDEGYDEWADRITKNYMHDWALSGLSAAIGRTEVSERRNTQAYLDAEEAMQKRLKEYQPKQTPPTEEELINYITASMPIVNEEELVADATTHGAKTVIVDGEEKLAYVKDNQLRKITLDSKQIPDFLSQMSTTQGKQFQKIERNGKGDYVARGDAEGLNLYASTANEPNIGVHDLAVIVLPAGALTYKDGTQNNKSVAAVRMRVGNNLVEYLLPQDFADQGLNEILNANNQLEDRAKKVNTISNSNDYYEHLRGVYTAKAQFAEGVANLTSRSSTNVDERDSGIPVSIPGSSSNQ